LSGGDEGLILANVDQQVVRVDNTATVRETIDMGTAQWERVAAEILLSTDPANPTPVEWNNLFTSQWVDGSGFNFSGENTWDKLPENYRSPGQETLLPVWKNTNPGKNFLTLNEMPADFINQNVHMDGYVVSTAPNGEKIFFLQESVRGVNGRVGKWIFAFSEATFNKRMEAWFRSGQIMFMPEAYLAEDNGCTLQATKFMCDNRLPNDLQLVEEFARTGNVLSEMPDGWLMPSPVVAR
jgi:hypothetical protein